MITHVSNFREVKRVKDVVRVFARIRRAMPATLVMVGDGPERVDAENEARELGVTADVRFLGRLDSVASLLQATRSLPAAVPDRVVRPRGARGDGLRRRPWSRAGRAACPRWSTTASTASSSRSGSVEAMGRRAVELLRDPAALRGHARGRHRQGAASSPPIGSCRCTRRSTRRCCGAARDESCR